MANYTPVPKAFPNLQKTGRLSVRLVVLRKHNGKQAFSIFGVALPANKSLREDLYGNTTNNHIFAIGFLHILIIDYVFRAGCEIRPGFLCHPGFGRF